MKKFFTLIVIINLIGIIVGSGKGAKATTMSNNPIEKDRLEIIKENGIITIAGPPKEYPFVSVNQETNQISGIEADILNEIISRLGIKKVEIKETTFANLLNELVLMIV